MLHSGSRGIGNILAKYHINVASEIARKYKIPLPNKDLAYLAKGTSEYDEYMRDLNWAQKYAWKNREVMMERVFEVLRNNFETVTSSGEVHCHHNFADMENHSGKNYLVTRKGAVRVRKGEYGIIPGSMGAKSYIVKGTGNSESFNSCSHGAGRAMGRKEAKRRFTLEEFKSQTEGIECKKDSSVIDEIPSAYKDIDTVMENQKDLVEPVHELKQFICIKG